MRPDEQQTPWIPANLIGSASDVDRDLRHRIDDFLTGAPWQPFADGNVAPRGLVVLTGPAPALASDVHTRVHRPLQLLIEAMIADRVPPAREDDVVAASLSTAAGVLGLLSPCNQMLVYPTGRHRAIVDAAIEFWPQFEALGVRYTLGLPEGRRLGALPTNLNYLLAHLGVPADLLSRPLPPDGPAALIGPWN